MDRRLSARENIDLLKTDNGFGWLFKTQIITENDNKPQVTSKYICVRTCALRPTRVSIVYGQSDAIGFFGRDVFRCWTPKLADGQK